MLKRTLSIIVADDHPVLREGMIKILEKESFISRLEEANNGREVIDLLEKNHFDLVLMDIRMEPMSGIQATKLIQTAFPKTKVLAFSMFNDLRIIEEMKSAGAVGYLLKNTEKAEIIEVIKTISLGGTHFQENCHVRQTHANYFSAITPKDGIKAKHLREIIFLLCIGKISKEIATILNLSTRTIEKYRNDLNEHLEIKNIAGIIRFGMDHGILEDEILKAKFDKYSLKTNDSNSFLMQSQKMY